DILNFLFVDFVMFIKTNFTSSSLLVNNWVLHSHEPIWLAAFGSIQKMPALMFARTPPPAELLKSRISDQIRKTERREPQCCEPPTHLDSLHNQKLSPEELDQRL